MQVLSATSPCMEADTTLRSRRSSPGSASPSAAGVLDSPLPPKTPIVIPPPTLRPQHVYAPVAPLGMLTLGVLSKKKKGGGRGGGGGEGEDLEGSQGDFKKLLNGKMNRVYRVYRTMLC